ncbi:hypothetical protein APED_17230 [Acanthopleuribacter pedis]
MTSPDQQPATPSEGDGEGKGYIRALYRCMLGLTLLGTPWPFLFWDWIAGASFICGAAFITLIVFLWDLSLGLALHPKRPNPVLGGLLVFLHYGLLGGVFYAMISLFDVSWAWFSTGTVVLVPGLLLALSVASSKVPTR